MRGVIGMNKLLLLGFGQESLPESSSDFIIASHTPGIPKGMSDREYYLKCTEMASEAKVVLVKSKDNYFSEDEVIILGTAYSNQTPIFYVGNTGTDSILQFMFANWFSSTAEAIDHIQVFY